MLKEEYGFQRPKISIRLKKNNNQLCDCANIPDNHDMKHHDLHNACNYTRGMSHERHASPNKSTEASYKVNHSAPSRKPRNRTRGNIRREKSRAAVLEVLASPREKSHKIALPRRGSNINTQNQQGTTHSAHRPRRWPDSN